MTSLDIYKPRGLKQLPILIFIHGGFWLQGDKGNFDYKAKVFVDHHFIYISIYYRPSHEIIFPSHAEDVGKAINWVYQNIASYGGNPEQIFVMGYSAGAHLVALVSTNEKFIKRY